MINRGDLVFKSKIIAKFGNHPYSLVSYKIALGKVDKNTIILYEENGEPRKNLRRIIDLRTGLLKGHLPARVVMGLLKALDNVRIEGDQLNRFGHLCIGDAKQVISFRNYSYYPISYEIHSGKVGPATVIIYDEKGRPVNKFEKNYRFENRIAQGAFAGRGFPNNLLEKLDNVRIEGNQLDSNGRLYIRGKPLVGFTHYPWHRVDYEIHRGKVDLSSIRVLNKKICQLKV